MYRYIKILESRKNNGRLAVTAEKKESYTVNNYGYIMLIRTTLKAIILY